MARKTLNIGAPTSPTTSTSTTASAQWRPPADREIPSDLMAGSAAAFLRWFLVRRLSFSLSQAVLHIHATDTGDGSAAGPDLSSDLENYESAFVIEAGGLSLTLPGPNHSDWTERRDGTEVYDTRVTGASTLRTNINNFLSSYHALTSQQKRGTTLTIDDGVVANSPPVITNPGNKSYEQGEAITAFDITTADADGDTVTVTVTGLPTGLAYNPRTRQVEGTVAANASAQAYTVTITANDGTNPAVTDTFTVTVTAPPVTITLNTIPTKTGEVVRALITAGSTAEWYNRRSGATVGAISRDSDLQISDNKTITRMRYTDASDVLIWNADGTDALNTIFGSGGDGENAVFDIATPYGNVSLTTTNTNRSGSAFLWLNLTTAQEAIISQIQANDLINLVISGFPSAPPPNTPPTITNPGNKSYQQGETITPFDITVTDPDAGDSVTVTVTGLPSGLSYNSVTDQVGGTVAANVRPQAYTATITANDGVNTAVTEDFTVTVTENTPPTITNPGNKSYQQGETITPFDITVTDPDAGDSVTVTVTGLPTGLAYNPRTRQVEGTVASSARPMAYTATITASDGTNPDVTETFTITITITNTPAKPVVPPTSIGVLTDRTKRYLTASRAIRANILVEIDARSAPGAVRTIRAIYQDQSRRIGEWYFDILTGRPPNIVTHAPDGGIPAQTSIAITVAPNIIPASYALEGQPVRIYYYIHHTDDKVILWRGLVSEVRRARAGTLEIAARKNTLDVGDLLRPVELQDFPNAKLSDIGKRIPLVFGNINDPPKRLLAEPVQTDIFTRTHTAAARAHTYGDVYYYDPAKETIGAWPSVVKDGEVFRPGLAPGPSSPREDSSLFTSTVDSTATFSNMAGSNTQRVFVYNRPAATRYTDIDISVEVRPFVPNDAHRSLVQNNCRITVKIGSGTATWATGTYYWDDLFDSRGSFPDTIHPTLSVTNRTAPASAPPWVEVNVRGWQIRSRFRIEYGITSTIPAPDLPDDPRFFQAITGYKDEAANYVDGAVVNTAGMALTNPIDVLHALCRDRLYGLRLPTAQVDRSNIAALRTAIPHRIDTQLGPSPQKNAFDTLSEIGRLFGLRIDTGDVWRFSAVNSDISALFTESDIADIDVRTTTENLRSPIVLRYGWSQITGSHQKVLVASHHHTLTGTGNVAGNTITFTDARSVADLPVAAGYKIVLDGVGTERSITAVGSSTGNAKTITFDGDARPNVNGQRFWAGPSLSSACLGANLRYKADREMVISTRLIQDDPTARYILNRLIRLHTTPKTTAEMRVTHKALAIDTGRNIAISHPSLPGTLQPAKSSLQNPILFSAADPYSASTARLVSVGSEVLKAESVSGRGLLNTLSTAHAAGSAVLTWAVLPKWSIEQVRVQGGRFNVLALLLQ